MVPVARLIIWQLALGAALAAPSHADGILDQAMKCWNIPPHMATSEYRATLDVDLDARGEVVDITAVTYEPRTEFGKAFVRSASIGVQRCSPYQVETAGRVRLEFDTSHLGNSVIYPFN